jgi:hypothetical protein
LLAVSATTPKKTKGGKRKQNNIVLVQKMILMVSRRFRRFALVYTNKIISFAKITAITMPKSIQTQYNLHNNQMNSIFTMISISILCFLILLIVHNNEKNPFKISILQ